MIPFVLQWNVPNVLNFFTLVIRWRKIISTRCQNHRFIQLIQIMMGTLKMIILWMHLVNIIRRYLRIRRKKHYLLKPHLLIQLLGGFR